MTHPHDFALLNDLLDERLSAAAAEDLRRRLVDEPALAAAHAELVRMRAALAALPVPVGAPGGEFLARVRARAGLPPSAARAPTAALPTAVLPTGAVPPGATSAIGGPGVGRSDAASTRNGHVGATTPPVAADLSASDVMPAPPAGRTLSLVRFAMPIAAVLGVALGAGLFAALRTDSEGETLSASAGAPAKKSSEAATAATDHETHETKDARPTVPGTPALPDAGAASEPPRGAPVEAPSTRGRIREGAGGGFRAPGGAVPEGLRTPSDVPSVSGPSVSGAKAPGTAAPDPAAPGPAESPVPPAPAPALDAAPPSDAASTAAGSVTSAARPGATPPAAAADDDDAARDDRTAAGTKRRAPTPRRDLRDGLARAEEGVDEVVVVRAASLDEARAQIALLALAPRRGARGLTGVPRPSAEALAADKLGAPDPTARANADEVLGSFVTELSAASYDALVSGTWAAPPTDARRRDLGEADATTSDAAKPGAAGAPPARVQVPPPSVPAPPVPVPPVAAAPVPAPSGVPRSAGRAAPATAPPAAPPAAPAASPTTPDGADDPKSEASEGEVAARATRRVRIVVLPR